MGAIELLTLKKADVNNSRELHKMQMLAFEKLLDKYQDVESNPGAEPLERIVQRMKQKFTDYYFITVDNQHIGAMRILRIDSKQSRISLMFILPEYQGKGYAQQAICEVENKYPDTAVWELDTIKQEGKLCYLYEKMGYVPTGREETIQDGMTIIYYRKRLPTGPSILV